MNAILDMQSTPSRYGRLRRNLTVSFVLIGVLSLGIAAWSVANDYQRRMNDAKLQTQVLARALDGHIDVVFSGAEAVLRPIAIRLAESGDVQKMDRTNLHQLLKAQSELVATGPVIYVLSSDSVMLGNSTDSELRGPFTQLAECLGRFRQQPNSSLCVSRPIRSPVTGKWRIPLSVAILGKDGRFQGVVGLGLDPEFFRNFYRSLGLGDDYALLLARNDGILLSRFPSEDGLPGRDISQNALFKEGVPLGDHGTAMIRSKFDERERLASFIRNARYPLVVAASLASDAILVPWKIDTAAKAAFVLFALLGIAGLFVISMQQVGRLEASELDLLLTQFSIDRSAEMVFWLELDGRIRYVNEAACVRSGYSREELLERTIFDLCPGVSPERWLQGMQALGRDRSRRLLENGRTKAGDTFPIDVFVDLVEFAGIRLACANARDVSAQRAAEVALRESELRYRSTVDSLQEGILVRDDRCILVCNPSAERIFGLPASQIVGQVTVTPAVTFYDVAGDVVKAGDGPAFRALRSGLPQYGLTYRLQRPDGTTLWVEANAVPLFRQGESTPYRVVATYSDITKRAEAVMELRASEEKFAKVFDLIPEMVTVTDLESGLYVDMNQAWAPNSGYAREDVIGRSALDLDVWVDAGERKRLVADVQAHGAVREREARFRRKDGSIYYGMLSGCAFEVQGRKLLMLIVRDVTRQKEADAARRAAEEALRVSEERFEIAVRNAEVGICDWRINEDQVHVSEVGMRLMGLPPGVSAVTRPELLDCVHHDDRQKLVAEMWGAVKQRRALQVEFRVSLPDANLRWLRGQGRATYGGDGRAYRLTGSLQDITESKRVEIALAESESKFREIFATSLDPIWIARVLDNGRIEYEDWNQTQATAVGFRVEEVLGKTPHEVYPKWAADIIDGRWRECVAAGVPMTWEERWPLAIGERVWISSVVPIRDAEGRIFRLAGVARDITERMAAEQSIRELNEALESRVTERTRELRIANQELEAFSYSVSHDLRAPLRAIEGFSALLSQAALPDAGDKSRDYLARIRAAALRMGRLIDDMLNLSRIGRHRLKMESFDLAQIAREVFEEIRAADPSRTVKFSVTGDLGVQGDASLIRIALTNLIGNAWKFTTPVSGAEIEVRGESAAGFVTVAVTDNGVGFDPAYRARLFGAFQRLHTEKEFAGTGIGLAIVQRIVHRHGGEISASGQPGEGASFVMKLPLATHVGLSVVAPQVA